MQFSMKAPYFLKYKKYKPPPLKKKHEEATKSKDNYKYLFPT